MDIVEWSFLSGLFKMMSVPGICKSLVKEIIWIQSNDRTVTEKEKNRGTARKTSLCAVL
jgi:hypothetical protein